MVLNNNHSLTREMTSKPVMTNLKVVKSEIEGNLLPLKLGHPGDSDPNFNVFPVKCERNSETNQSTQWFN